MASNPALVPFLLTAAMVVLVYGWNRVEEFGDTPPLAPARFRGAASPSVYSSLPSRQRHDMAWKYVADYDTACMHPVGAKGMAACRRGQRYRVYVTPHNQRYGVWY